MRAITIPVILFIVLSACTYEGDSRVYRGTNSNGATQVVVSTEFNLGSKSTTILRRYAFNPATQTWDEKDLSKDVKDSEVRKAIENLSRYEADPNAPPLNNAVARPPANVYIASNYGNSSLIVLNPTTLAETARINTSVNIADIDTSPDGARVALLLYNELRLIDVTTNTSVRSIPLPAGGAAVKVHFSPDGSFIYVVDGSRGVHVIRASTLTIERTVAYPTGIISANNSFLSPDGDTLIVSTAGTAGTAILDTNALLWSTTGSLSIFSTTPCAFHPNGHELYCGGATGVNIINAFTLTSTTVRIPTVESPLQVHLVEGGQFLVFTTDKAIRFYNTSTRALIQTITPAAGRTFTNSFALSTL